MLDLKEHIAQVLAEIQTQFPGVPIISLNIEARLQQGQTYITFRIGTDAYTGTVGHNFGEVIKEYARRLEWAAGQLALPKE